MHRDRQQNRDYQGLKREGDGLYCLLVTVSVGDDTNEVLEIM